MVDPDNEERLLKVPPHVVARIKAEAYAQAVEAVRALPRPLRKTSIVAVIEALTASEDSSADVGESQHHGGER